jgi:hypothetical protein
MQHFAENQLAAVENRRETGWRPAIGSCGRDDLARVPKAAYAPPLRGT